MSVQEFNSQVGAIVMNLQAIETAIRFFFYKKNGETSSFPKPGGKETPSSSLTAYRELGKWVRKFNSSLTKEEVPKYGITNNIVEIRDAIAHGRLVAPQPPGLPYTLWKFGQAVNGISPVRFCEILTAEWLAATVKLLDSEIIKVLECHKARGYSSP